MQKRLKQNIKNKSNLIAPVMVSTIMFIFSLCLWWTLLQDERNTIREKTQKESIKLLAYIESDLQSRIPALERIAKRWETRKGTPKKEFLADGAHYVQDLPGTQSVEWVDTDYKVKWITPLEGNEKSLNLDLTKSKSRYTSLLEAMKTQSPTMTNLVTLVQGGKGFYVYIPIITGTKLDGFVLAVFKANTWLQHVIYSKKTDTEKKDFIPSVYLNGVEAYSDQARKSDAVQKYRAISNRDFYNQNFSVTVYPTKQFVNSELTLIPTLTLIAGSIIAFFAGLIIYLLNHSREEAKALKQAKNKLARISSSFDLATDAGDIGVWTWDVKTNHLDWNDRNYEIFDTPKGTKLTYESWRKTVHPNDLDKAEKLLQETVQSGVKFDTEFRIVLESGEVRHVKAVAEAEKDTNGKLNSITGINIDITEQKLAAQRLADEKEKLANIIEGTDVGTWEWNIQTGEIKVNERWASLLGYTLDEVSPVTINISEQLCHPDDLKQSNQRLTKHFRHILDYYDCEVRMKHRDGHWVWIHDRGRVFNWTEDGKPLLMFGTHQDITERKNNEERIKHLATHDNLTNLPARALAEDRLKVALATAKRKRSMVGVLFIDLDGFKEVNDSHGHNAGDELLQAVSSRLAACVRKNDTVARIGGDEFLIILSDMSSRETIETVAKKILRRLAEPLYLKEGIVGIGSSIGISLFPDVSESPADLIREADKAMYSIKKSGKNNYSFADSNETTTI